MNLLFVIDRYRPSKGGAERYLADLGAALAARGHAVGVAALEAEPDERVPLLRLGAPPFPRWLREWTFAARAAGLHRAGCFDCVLGFRHVLSVDRFQPHEGLFIDSLEGALRPPSASRLPFRVALALKKRRMKNRFFLHADRALFRGRPGLPVAALSEMTARSIRSRFHRFAPRVTVIPNGVDLDRFYPARSAEEKARLRREHSLPLEGALALFAGHNFRLKGLSYALAGTAEALRRGADARLVVAGREPPARYERAAARLGLSGRVHFLGAVADMAPLYRSADLLLHPTFYDPCSLVVLEALGSGLPVVTTRFNGACELMEGRAAGRILERPQDTPALAEAICDLLHPARHPAFCQEAARLGADCDFTRHVDRMESWLEGG